MKILVITQYFWPENFRVNDLVAGLRERGHETVVLTGLPNYPAGRFFRGYGPLRGPWTEEYRGARVLRAPLCPRGKSKGWQLALNYLSFAFTACMAALFRLRGRFDIVFVFEPSPVTVGLPAVLIRRLKRAPVIFWVLDMWPETLEAVGRLRSGTALRLVESMVRFIYRRCDMILASSKGFLPGIAKKGGRTDRMHYFPNWIEESHSRSASNAGRKDMPELPPGFRVMFAGNVGGAQDFETIVAAAEKLKSHGEIQWIIIGDGHRSAWLKEQVRSRGLAASLHLLGRFPPEMMADFFDAADVMLVTLRSDPVLAITVPGKIQSYLACGKPVVGALNGEGADLIRQAGAGIACPAGNADGLAEAVLTLYGMKPEQRIEMGMKGKAYSDRHFGRDMLMGKLEAWMLELSGADNGRNRREETRK